MWVDGNFPNTTRFLAEAVRSPIAVRTGLTLLYSLGTVAVLADVSLAAGSFNFENIWVNRLLQHHVGGAVA